jgi:hexosaminidase
MRLVVLACILASSLVVADRPPLLPMPVEIAWGAGEINSAEARVVVKPGSVPAPACADEAYELEISPSTGIRIRANTEQGVRHARATLAQLTRGDRVTCASIRDWPAFPIRGLMHDVGRNFQSLALVKRQVDLMARYKLNTFHWHLTDYQRP